jgi:hydrogenase maturation protein HypF
LANSLGLTGFVLNIAGMVKIEVQGPGNVLREFSKKLEASHPSAAKIDKVQIIPLELIEAEVLFYILEGETDSAGEHRVPADRATCNSCRQELFDSGNRRYLYPFIACTDCGPRFTVIKTLPYERKNTSMADFTMCLSCQSEYEDPDDRRFHFQGNCCANCGPRLELLDGQGQVVDKGVNVLERATNALASGKILALKGLGGYHLTCDATDTKAVKRLRQMKARPEQSLALMVPNTDDARMLVEFGQADIELLQSAQAPIVILPLNKQLTNTSNLIADINPDGNTLGVFLPYTPLHLLLCYALKRPLVMTSANAQGLPMATTISQSLEMFAGSADFFITHNRDIVQACDDSVVLSGNEVHSLRRSRGFAPEDIKLPFKTTANILAVGGHLKNTVCLTKDDHAFLSQHVGTLDNLETSRQCQNVIRHYKELLNCCPAVIACDAHPDYISTLFAEQLAIEYQVPLVRVQHHHAHIAAVMVEHKLSEPVIGIAFDGLGYGLDGALWGGEFLVCDYNSFIRRASLRPVPMCGGAAAVKEPWRMALSYLLEFESEFDANLLQFAFAKYEHIELIRKQYKAKLNTPLTNSCGRLFDAVASLLDLKQIISYEGQAAMMLQCLAERALTKLTGDLEAVPYNISWKAPVNKRPDVKPNYFPDAVCDTSLLFRELLCDLRSGVERDLIALRFHSTLANMVLQSCLSISHDTGIAKVVLSGGVFQNQLLLAMSKRLLQSSGFDVYSAERIPANDGGISLGQAAIAGSMLNQKQIYKDTQTTCV